MFIQICLLVGCTCNRIQTGDTDRDIQTHSHTSTEKYKGIFADKQTNINIKCRQLWILWRQKPTRIGENSVILCSACFASTNFDKCISSTLLHRHNAIQTRMGMHALELFCFLFLVLFYSVSFCQSFVGIVVVTSVKKKFCLSFIHSFFHSFVCACVCACCWLHSPPFWFFFFFICAVQFGYFV